MLELGRAIVRIAPLGDHHLLIRWALVRDDPIVVAHLDCGPQLLVAIHLTTNSQ